MLGPPLDSIPPHYNPYYPANLPPPHPHMYKIMPSHHSIDPNRMMIPHSSGSSCSSKILPLPSVSDPMQQHFHHLPPSHYVKMHHMDPLIGPLPSHHHQQQQHMRFSPMVNDNFAMGTPHPHLYIHPPHSMHGNDDRPLPQSINNTYVSATMSIQQLNIQNLDSGGLSGEFQPGTIHYHASSPNMSDSRQPQPFSSNDSQYSSRLDDLQALPSNLNSDDIQPPPYW